MKNKQKILIIGSGGREHALAWKLAQSPRVGKLYVAPGNAGTAEIAENVPMAADDIVTVVNFAETEHIDLVVVTPDDPLAAGMVNALEEAGIRAFGPRKAAARIEASKAFSKELMKQRGIPTAAHRTFVTFPEAHSYAATCSYPIVVKASGLALGKGVYICSTADEAEAALKEIMLDARFGEAGNEVVIEEFLEGQEVSIHVVSDGNDVVLFPAAQDHKQIGEGDTGPNTGGMGVIAPVPWVTPELIQDIEVTIIEPTLRGLADLGAPFQGCLYPGLMVRNNHPKVLEFNARFGDPETQVYMRLLDSDVLNLLEGSIDGTVEQVRPQWRAGFAVTIVLAAGGYPESYRKGDVITGIDEANKQEGVVVFQAGTVIEDGKLVTSGGRVLNVTAVGDSLQQALDRAYAAIDLIHFEGMYYRKDIGFRVNQA